MDEKIVAAQKTAEKITANIEQIIIGKEQAIELAIIGLISKGHLLIEDAPGVGKTMLARSLAKAIDCTFKRIQFTPDILPSDITGVAIYNQKTSDFEFRAGPIMANIVLADEINRATPKVQSALLECMEEGRISIEGVTHELPSPFHILATQNPIEYEGTFPLPETQLDRFLLRLSLGYPSIADEIAIMENQQYSHPIEELKPVATSDEVLNLQAMVKKIYVDDLVKNYISSLVAATRQHTSIYLGASPRGSLALFRTGQARALLAGRDFVLPDDIKALAEPVLAHRLIVRSKGHSREESARTVISQLLETVLVPGTIATR
ncbi:MAG: MoxR family ATPase [Dehalococcoidales bacterium]|jgi:MoxR-like ATPase|nr:MoxR family ATPase [Dehalococcoidales bacterium]MDP6737699.1 MoxR family ATPase [Dehalococcoidales bacterium]|tara:strand:+ start:3418 stop:4380 length:963 start_codon:yes stop_codon:yes gene_type:complete